MVPPETTPVRSDGGVPPAHREGADSAAAAALGLDVDTGDVPTTEPGTVAAALRGGDPVTPLDVRGEDEVAAWRVEGESVDRVTVPAAAFVDAHPDPDRVRELVADLGGRPVVVVCPRGRASRRVAAVLRAAVRERLGVLSPEREAFVDGLVGDIPPRPANFRTVTDVNLGRTTVDADRAFTIELGPNDCATTPDADR